jgi:hypothetical protein
MKKTRGGRMTAAKRRAAKVPKGRGLVRKRRAGRNAKQIRNLFSSYPENYKKSGIIVKTGKRGDVFPYTIFINKFMKE